MFGFLSLNRIFFSQLNNLPCLVQRARASLVVFLPKLCLVLLLSISALLSFSSSSISSPLATVEMGATGLDAQLATSNSIAPAKLDQFAQAYLQVLKLLGDRQSELPDDETTPTTLDIQRSIEDDTIRIIQGSGLTLPEYMQILEMANQDETFQRQIFDRLPMDR
jgi:hypothetical protein